MTVRTPVAILIVGAILTVAGLAARAHSESGGIVAVAEPDLRWADFPGRPGVKTETQARPKSGILDRLPAQAG